MRRFWFLVVAGLMFVSCNVIQGDLELLVDEETSAHTPAWSSDGSKIYFTIGFDPELPDAEGPLWSLDLTDYSRRQITEQEADWGGEVAPDADYSLARYGWKVYIWEIETLDTVCTYQLRSESKMIGYHGPNVKFSYHSYQILYYAYSNDSNDTIFVHRANIVDSTDEEILVIKSNMMPYLPGPGDSLLLLCDTIYNLNSGEKIAIDLYAHNYHWNPAVPGELLISNKGKDIFLFDVETREITRINAGAPKTYVTSKAKFSPDGQKIVIEAERNSDGLGQIWLFSLSD